MQKTEEVNRIGLSFRKDSQTQSDAYRFLSGCGRQKTDVVALSVTEFAQKYGLGDSMGPDGIRKFLRNYEYIRHAAALRDGVDAPAPASGSMASDAPAAVEDAIPDERISAKSKRADNRTRPSSTQGLDVEQGAAALAAFGM